MILKLAAVLSLIFLLKFLTTGFRVGQDFTTMLNKMNSKEITKD